MFPDCFFWSQRFDICMFGSPEKFEAFFLNSNLDSWKFKNHMFFFSNHFSLALFTCTQYLKPQTDYPLRGNKVRDRLY